MTLDAEAWRAAAACKDYDTNLWFPERGKNAARAKLICRTCPVSAECVGYALDNHIGHGIFGGLDERGRRSYRRTKLAAGVPPTPVSAPTRTLSVSRPGGADRRPDGWTA